jgi:hypothetical protein
MIHLPIWALLPVIIVIGLLALWSNYRGYWSGWNAAQKAQRDYFNQTKDI